MQRSLGAVTVAGALRRRADWLVKPPDTVVVVWQFNASAMETLIRSRSNKVTWEMHAIQLVQLVKCVKGCRPSCAHQFVSHAGLGNACGGFRYENACTFTFSGYNNPIRQHLYHCDECDKDVCLVCATHCHTHEECDAPKVSTSTRRHSGAEPGSRLTAALRCCHTSRSSGSASKISLCGAHVPGIRACVCHRRKRGCTSSFHTL